MRGVIKSHLLYSAVLLLLALAFLKSWWLMPNSHTLGDMVTYYYPRAVMLQQSVLEYHDFVPLWNPYIFSGDPFLAKPNIPGFFFVLGPLLLLMKPMAALHWNVIIDLFLSGLFMYLLVHYLYRDRMAAFISAVAYMFSGFFLTTVIFYGWVVFGNAYFLIPLFLFFLFRAYRESFLPNSIAAGAVLGLTIVGGSGIEFLYATVMLGLFLVAMLAGSRIRKRVLKSAAIGAVVIAVCFGVSAFKLLPVLEYQQTSVRSSLDWASASGRNLSPSRFFSDLVEPGFPKIPQDPSNKLGIVVVALAAVAVAAAFSRFLKSGELDRSVLFFVLVIIVALLLASGSFLLWLFWKFYPGWGGMRYANRAVIMLVPAVAALAGLGALSVFGYVRKRFPNRLIPVFVVLSALVVADLAVFGSGGDSNAGDAKYKYRDMDELLAANMILQNISAEGKNSAFRIYVLETTGIDWGTEFYNVPLGLEGVYGYDTQFQAEYMHWYLGMALARPDLFLGILNVKYLTTMQPKGVEGFDMVGKFGNCSVCFPEEPAIQKAWGPYLHVNTKVLPRAYLTGSAMLVQGSDDFRLRLAQTMMVGKDFDPRRIIVVSGSRPLEDYSFDEFRRFTGVVAEELGGNDEGALRRYYDSGGVVLTVLNDSLYITPDESRRLWALNRTSGYVPVDDGDVVDLSFDRKEIILPPDSRGKFLVLSERYSMFPGWTARAGGKGLEILRANGVVSAVYLDGSYDKVMFEYRPWSFVLGSYITLATVLLLLAFIVNLARNIKRVRAALRMNG